MDKVREKLIVVAEQWKPITISFIIGLILGLFIIATNSKKEIANLKHYGDSLVFVAAQRDSSVTVANVRAEAAVDSLKQVQSKLVVVVARNKKIDTQLSNALDSAATTADSNQILTQQNTNLRESKLTLEQALANMTAQRDSEFTRAEFNLQKFEEANRDVIRLNAQIQKLGPSLPGWVRNTAKVAVVGVAFYAGTRVHK